MSITPVVPFYSPEPLHRHLARQMNEAFSSVVEGCQYITGTKLKEFESTYAAYSGSSYCIGVNSGLDALIIALQAIGIGSGDEVIVPANTFFATALAVIRTGAFPVLVDPDAMTFNIDVQKISASITDKTRAIIAVHLYGQMCDMTNIKSIAAKYNIAVIEDNAQAQGARINKKQTGSWGIINATSFYPSKNLGALGDGGAITTDYEQLAHKCRALRNYGSTEKYKHEWIGYNSRLDEVQAALLSVKMQSLDECNKERISIAHRYAMGLVSIGDIILPVIMDDASHVYHIFAIQTKRRKELQQHLSENGIQTLIHYPIPLHLQPALSYLGYKRGDLPVTERLADQVLSLPIYPGLREKQVDLVIEKVKEFFTSSSN